MYVQVVQMDDRYDIYPGKVTLASKVTYKRFLKTYLPAALALKMQLGIYEFLMTQ